MRRRAFIAGLGGAAIWPLMARAQPSAMPVVGFLRSTSLADSTFLVAAFSQGLKEAGFVEGQNVAVEYRYAENHPDRLPALALELIARPVAVIVGDNIAAIAAKAATRTVPIVFASGGDPVKSGLVASLNRPGGNVTGVTFFSGVVGAKRLELLRGFAPKMTTVAVLLADTPTAEAEQKDVQGAAQAVGQQLIVLKVNRDGELESAFDVMVRRGAGALLVGGSAFLSSHRAKIIALAARHALPAMYFQREAVVDGGLMSYGASLTDAYRQTGVYAGRIVKGENPADLPVMQPSKFEFVINLKTAKALGLAAPPTLLALADEVIE
jgi:putative tryptophan/tyrosine transport system substrate-binding protein